MRVFAAGNLTNKLRIEVSWRSGLKSVIADAAPNYIYEIDESAACIRSRWGAKPRCGIILGSGLGSVGEAIELEEAIDELPNEQREAFVAHEIEGISFKELAERTGVGVNTLLTRKR